MPDISVIMPTYNRERYIESAVESVLRQTKTDFELIIINDGSTDRTEQIIRKFDDRRIRYHAQANQGEYAATNQGLRLAQGAYITWAHSDDLLPTDSLGLRYQAAIANPDCDFVHAAFSRMDETGQIFETLAGSPLAAAGMLERYCLHYIPGLGTDRSIKLLHFPTMLVKSEFVKKIGLFDDSLSYAGDFDWVMRALHHANKIEYINAVTYLYRTHAASRRATEADKLVNEKQILQQILGRYCQEVAS